MAVIDKKPASLQALTAAALLLPGLTPVRAADDEFSVQYGHYEESDRNLGTAIDFGNGLGPLLPVTSTLRPITVDTFQGSGKLRISDRIKFEANFVQDTWSGATPISTAPSSRSGNRVTYLGDTVSGASPFLQSDSYVLFDANRKPVKYAIDPNTFEAISLGTDHPVHTMAMASPETRQEGNFKLGYEWDDAALSARGGVSSEPDYQSRFAGLGLRLDFDQKRTTLDFGANYSNAYTHALINSSLTGYTNSSAFDSQKVEESVPGSSDPRTFLTGNREEWGGTLNLTQVVSAYSLFKAGAGYTHSAGYLENPYKYVSVFTLSDVSECSLFFPSSEMVYCSGVTAYSEQRPNNRNQWNLSTGWVQYVPVLDAALHFDYSFFHDDWGINAHTFAADWVQPLGAGWSVTPRIRYYSQSAADFYAPYVVLDGTQHLPNNFSSDQRLSAYGALSGGLTVSKQLAKGLRLEGGIEYYTHQGAMNIGSGGEDSYADFSYYVASGSLTVDIAQLGRAIGEGGEHAHHHAHHHGARLPAGVMFGHMLGEAGQSMVGYRYSYSREDGDLLRGGRAVGDREVIAQGCRESGVNCRIAPAYMDMQMHMLDLMYAPTDWLNLMVMPQFMSMDMDSRGLAGVTPAVTGMDHLHGTHTTSGIGDTGMYALFKLFGERGQNVHLTLGVSAPTGDTAIEMNRMHGVDAGYIHYGMQLGSGTWDFKPSLTYTGKLDDWSWGAQVGGTKRLNNHNDSGYLLGDNLQATAWGSYSLFDWLDTSVRGVYAAQDSIRGRFKPLVGNYEMHMPDISSDVNYKNSTADQPGNYGGHYWDLGLGLNAYIADGKFAGNQFSVEWLQPLMEDGNGYQLERFGSLNATWSYMF